MVQAPQSVALKCLFTPPTPKPVFKLLVWREGREGNGRHAAWRILLAWQQGSEGALVRRYPGPVSNREKTSTALRFGTYVLNRRSSN
jgi:hypothetical protein